MGKAKGGVRDKTEAFRCIEGRCFSIRSDIFSWSSFTAMNLSSDNINIIKRLFYYQCLFDLILRVALSSLL